MLDEKEIALVAICTDTPAQLREGRPRHDIQGTLLSDADLSATDRLNLRNPFNVSPRGLGGLPIPTTFLVDAAGKVAWIDQTDDYMLRSSPGRVLGAINETLD
ncbi:MAG: peroxiredoxin [Deltaproteobacteria bacterium]|nr:peroxiredoxin [Deltaproteobacteria bacterium]